MNTLATTLSTRELRANLSDVLGRASYGGERIGVTKNGRLTAIVIEEDRLAAFVDKLLVKYVEHLEERAALRDVLQLVGFKGALLFRSFLAPDFQCYIDILIHDSVVFE